MNFNGFSKTGNWYKGNLHCHTTHTDGKKTAAEVVAMYKEAGYSFLAITDHDVFYDYRNTLQTEDMVLLPAFEGSAYLVDDEVFYEKICQNESADSLDMLWDEHKIGKCVKAHHINAILGTKEMQEAATKEMFTEGKLIPPPLFVKDWNGVEVLQHLVDDFRARGFFVTYNHPTWSKVEIADVSGVSGIWAMEVYNHSTHIVNNCSDEYFIDAMATRGNDIDILATDDNHNVEGDLDSFGGYIMVQAEALCHEDLVKNMLAGNYYSSTGCEIYDWGIKDGQVFVSCEDCKWIRIVVDGHVGDGEVYQNKGEALCEATYQLCGNENSVRIECTNHKGEKAWTNFCIL